MDISFLTFFYVPYFLDQGVPIEILLMRRDQRERHKGMAMEENEDALEGCWMLSGEPRVG